MEKDDKLVSKENKSTELTFPLQQQSLEVDTKTLNTESVELVNKIIAETNIDKQKDLTYLFNINQRKKTAARQNKLSDLQDKLVDEAVKRLLNKPDEIDNKQLFDSMKTVQDMMERNQKQMSGASEEQAPLIQINQQNNDISLGGVNNLDQDSRKRIQGAISALLGAAKTTPPPVVVEPEEVEVVDNIIDGEDD